MEINSKPNHLPNGNDVRINEFYLSYYLNIKHRMKKLFLSILSLLLIASTGIAQTRIIEHPQFESTNTISFEITKLEFKNSETVLYCDVYNSPGEWILLSSSSYLKHFCPGRGLRPRFQPCNFEFLSD